MALTPVSVLSILQKTERVAVMMDWSFSPALAWAIVGLVLLIAELMAAS
ncbi:MAG: hypothetical protein GYA70_03705, partial [Deltaproteobacteria bacterium]|nr:hypothetical protein [Deltaproteobacteria bacterium]